MTSLPAAYEVDAQTLDLLERRKPLRRRGWLVRRALLTADVVGLFTAFLITELVLRSRPVPNNQISQLGEYILFFAALPLWVVAAKLYGLYDRDEERTNHSTADDFAGVFQLMTINMWLIQVTAYVVEFGHPDILKLVVFWLLSITFVSLARAGGRAICRRQLAYIQNTVIIGSGAAARALAERILRHPEYGLNLVGLVTTDGDDGAACEPHLAVLGKVEQVPEVVSLLDVDRVVVACEWESDPDLIRSLNGMGVQVDIVPRFHEVISSDIGIHMIEGMPVIGLPAFSLSRSSALLKRWMDILGATVGLIVLSPLMLAVALAVKLDSSGPALFRQVRMGADDQPFRILKFRTMRADAEDRKSSLAHLSKYACDSGRKLFKIENDPRVTRVGGVLRRTSIDELPQLWNVLRGDMSLVGPRPLILEEQAQVRDWERKRLGLRPGMTGLWQVLGRDDIPFAEMLRLDYLYVTNWTVGGDVRLLLRTVPVMLRGSQA